MMVSKDRPMTRDPSPKGIGGAVGWPIAIALAAAMLAGIFAGYNQAAVENGGEPLPAWLGPLVGIGFCAIAGAFYLRAYGAVWRQRSPRKRRYWLALGVAALVGALIGVWSMADSDTPAAEVAMIADGPVSPGFAIGASLLWLLGLAVSMVLYHRAIDDHEERAWLWASLAGWYSFVFPAPVWWMLHRANLAPPVDAMALFLLSLVVNAVIYLWMKFRR